MNPSQHYKQDILSKSKEIDQLRQLKQPKQLRKICELIEQQVKLKSERIIFNSLVDEWKLETKNFENNLIGKEKLQHLINIFQIKKNLYF